MAIFMDIEFVSIVEADPPDAFSVAFDVIYAGETWCRSIVEVDTAGSARLGWDEQAVVGAARDALLDLLDPEPGPISFHLRMGGDGTVVLDKARPW
jgi:hypothetical protein